MSTTGNLVAERIVTSTKADPNRATTPADVATLQRVWQRLTDAGKRHKMAVADLRKELAVWTEGLDTGPLADQATDTAAVLASELAECRPIVEGLPRGVTAKGGGATRQTVILEFYGNVNRDLKARITPTDAKKINKAAFGN